MIFDNFVPKSVQDESSSWNWFHFASLLIRKDYRAEWNSNRMNAFISKRNAKEILQNCRLHTILFRFHHKLSKSGEFSQ